MLVSRAARRRTTEGDAAVPEAESQASAESRAAVSLGGVVQLPSTPLVLPPPPAQTYLAGVGGYGSNPNVGAWCAAVKPWRQRSSAESSQEMRKALEEKQVPWKPGVHIPAQLPRRWRHHMQSPLDRLVVVAWARRRHL